MRSGLCKESKTQASTISHPDKKMISKEKFIVKKYFIKTIYTIFMLLKMQIILVMFFLKLLYCNGTTNRIPEDYLV
jgi:hypothetical protein